VSGNWQDRVGFKHTHTEQVKGERSNETAASTRPQEVLFAKVSDGFLFSLS